jgi:hypothetical protein
MQNFNINITFTRRNRHCVSFENMFGMYIRHETSNCTKVAATFADRIII